MLKAHYDLWERCADFVHSTCGSRDASHGLAHMRKVTEQAVLLFLMDCHESQQHEFSQKNSMLYRIILVGMLHDVADHKYDTDGKLMERVDEFALSEAAHLQNFLQCEDQQNFPSRSYEGCNATLSPSTATAEVEAIQHCILLAVNAVSYSKEAKRGMRWFVSLLRDQGDRNEEWVQARDYVSDADKLEAIGEEGLLRCYEYKCACSRAESLQRRKEEPEAPVSLAAYDAAAAQSLQKRVEAVFLKEVAEHFDEKLKRLMPVFMVTTSGLFVAKPRHREMTELLDTWKREGPPPVTLFWRNFASEYMAEKV